MIDEPLISVIITSRNRAVELTNLLHSLRHQIYANFEVIVVGNYLPEEFKNKLRYIEYDKANISAARNIGIAHSAGTFLAFCDDDCIPDPTWLQRLIVPFENEDIGASGGYTRSRNGICLQWGAMRFDRAGNDIALNLCEKKSAYRFDANPEQPVKLVGTNMAFRKSAILEIGGFDEAFRFFLDETDAKLRLDEAGWKTAVIPNAQVHHKYAASERRKANRAPTDLFEIGASKALFCQKHFKGGLRQELDQFADHQLERLKKLEDRKEIDKGETARLIDSLETGFADGLKRTSNYSFQHNKKHEPILYDRSDGPHVLLLSKGLDTKWLKSTAQKLVLQNCSVSALTLEFSAKYFQTHFSDGFWHHVGGVWGKSLRSQRVLQFCGYETRFKNEARRLSPQFQFDFIVSNKSDKFTANDNLPSSLDSFDIQR